MAMAWFVARTRPLAEFLAKDHLEAKAIECFLPAVSTPCPRRGRQDTPLFPGYLFLRYDLQERGMMPLRWVQGLVGLVAFESVAPSIPEAVIDELEQRMAEIDGSGGLWRRDSLGDRVLVRLGSSESETLAEVVEGAKSPHGRVRVLLEFLGRLAHAEVPWQNVRPASDSNVFREPAEYLSCRRTRGKGRYLHGEGLSARQNERASL